MQRTKIYVSVDPRPFAHRDRFSLSSSGLAVSEGGAPGADVGVKQPRVPNVSEFTFQSARFNVSPTLVTNNRTGHSEERKGRSQPGAG